ncbi:MAG: hypothetical protein OEW25_05560, partial [Nitrospira sp.]|nr:hypothetical protein [Nitrospira sp.]
MAGRKGGLTTTKGDARSSCMIGCHYTHHVEESESVFFPRDPRPIFILPEWSRLSTICPSLPNAEPDDHLKFDSLALASLKYRPMMNDRFLK